LKRPPLGNQNRDECKRPKRFQTGGPGQDKKANAPPEGVGPRICVLLSALSSPPVWKKKGKEGEKRGEPNLGKTGLRILRPPPKSPTLDWYREGKKRSCVCINHEEGI